MALVGLCNLTVRRMWMVWHVFMECVWRVEALWMWRRAGVGVDAAVLPHALSDAMGDEVAAGGICVVSGGDV